MLSIDIPLISQIEHAEAVRTLPVFKRMEYTVGYITLISAAFLGAILVSTAAAIVVFGIITNTHISFDQQLVMILPVAGAFMVAIGFTTSPMPETIMSGDTSRSIMWRAARSGIVSGFILGSIFGLIWSLVVRVGLVYIHLNTIFSQSFDISEIIIFSLMLGLIIAPVYAVFRAFSSIAGYLLLHLLNKR